MEINHGHIVLVAYFLLLLGLTIGAVMDHLFWVETTTQFGETICKEHNLSLSRWDFDGQTGLKFYCEPGETQLQDGYLVMTK